jgi:hypothetical protein
MKLDKKQMMIVGGALVLLLVLGFLFFRGRVNTNDNQGEQTEVEDLIPTVDASVKVSLEASDSTNHEVVLTASNIPAATQAVDYELSYQTASQGLQGVIGTITTIRGRGFEKKLTLGTCSSGTCVYHQVVGKIKLTLKFSGDYGEKLFEKEYSL